MAIYTSYGRYIKAKLFKDELENKNDSYLVLGLGNPKWDDPSSGQNIPVAPYNTAILNYGDISTNQFYDNHINQYFLCTDSGGGNKRVEHTLNNGVPEDGTYINNCATLNPPGPCIWQNYTDNKTVIAGITQNNYQNYYISPNDATQILSINDEEPILVDPSTLNQEELYYYSELYLRGEAKQLSESFGAKFKHPAGLLGAVKCSVMLVRDLQEAGKEYTADLNQFWYGDRYWETVNPNDADIDADASISDNPKAYLYPHHVLISAIINPRQLCTNLTVDRNIAPRQISLYTKTKSNSNLSQYRVSEYAFNFGQYVESDIGEFDDGLGNNYLLNFTLPYIDSQSDAHYPNGDFKFVMSDYIKGAVRDVHSAERIGYIVGF